MAQYYPVLMDLTGKPVLIVGGGPIAARKAASILPYGPKVTIIARQASEPVRAMAARGDVTLHERPFEDADLADPWLVFAATNDRALHEHIKALCDARRIACNVVDVTDLCSFIVPSIIRHGELMVTISTDGTCPSYSKYQRQRLERCCFGPGSERMLHVVAAARELLKTDLGHGMNDEEKFELLRGLIEGGELAAVLSQQGEEAAMELARVRIQELVEARR